MSKTKECVFSSKHSKCQSDTHLVDICLFCFTNIFKDIEKGLDYFNLPYLVKGNHNCKICTLPQEIDMEFGSIYICGWHDNEFS